jgi:ABC-2 type transport system ATP-binding protein
MIRVEHVSKWFGDVVALSDVSFQIGSGVVALLGPNGAGKSSMIRVICGLCAPSQGRVLLLGRPPRRERGLARQIGLVPQQEAMLEALTGREFVRLAAVLSGLGDADAAAARALDVVGLDPADGRTLRAYSKGMRQRAKVAQALVHDPEVLVLDEPLNGLDPRQRVHLIELFQRLGADGRCVLVSSHVLEEVERFGSQVLVLARGRLIAQGDFRAIRDLLDERPRRLRVRSSDPRAMAVGLLDTGVSVGVQLEAGGDIVVDTADVNAMGRAIAGVAARGGIRLFELTPIDDDLESVFRYLVAGAS